VASLTIASIVEGHGEVKGLPKILHRIAQQHAIWDLRVHAPFRVPRGRLTVAGGIENAVADQARRVPGAGGVLVLLDADDDCPATLGPALLARAQAARPDRSIAVVLPKIEFEAWFIAAAPSLGGTCGLPDDLEVPPDPEGIRNAKGWITDHRTDGLRYSPTADQATLSSAFDLELARKMCRSFDKFQRDVERLMGVSGQ
jgi:hypothetical protein